MIKISLCDDEDFSFFVRDGKDGFIQQKIDDILVLAKLLGYSYRFTRTVVSDSYAKLVVIDNKNDINLFAIKFHLNNKDKLMKATTIFYVGSDGEVKEVSTRQRSIKYILKKAEYLIK